MAGCARGLWPPQDALNRFVRWSRMGIFDQIFANLAAENGPPDRVMIDSTHLKAHRTAASLLKRGIHPRFIGRTKGGLNSKLHAVCDGAGRSVIFLLTEGQMSDSMRYDRCAHTFFSAICIAATVIFWLGQ